MNKAKKLKTTAEWKTTQLGAPLPKGAPKTLSNINPAKQLKALRWIEEGYETLITGPTKAKIRLGYYCAHLRRLLGDAGFFEVAKHYWCASPESWPSLKRTLQYAQQTYHFSRRKGAKLTTEVPFDTYLNICRHVEKLKSEKAKNRMIREINSEGTYNGVPLGKTKQIRRAIRMVESEIPTDAASATEVAVTAVRSKRVALNRATSSAMNIAEDIAKRLKNLRSLPDSELRNEIAEVRQTLKIIQSWVTEALERIHRLAKKGGTSSDRDQTDEEE